MYMNPTDQNPNGRARSSSAADPSALVERGYNYLSVWQFNNADDCFSRALDLNASLHQAYWGLLLSLRQCRNTEELAQKGLCFDSEPNYGFACRYASDPAAKSEYVGCAKRAAMLCHLGVLELVRQCEYYKASLRAKNYASSAFCDGRIAEIHDILIKGADTEPNINAPKVYILLLALYGADPDFTKLDGSMHFTDKVKNDYKSAADRVFQSIVAVTENKPIQTAPVTASTPFSLGDYRSAYFFSQYNQEMLEKLNRHISYADAAQNRQKEKEEKIQRIKLLCDAWAKPCEAAFAAYAGCDGKPSDFSKRYLYLTDALKNIDVYKTDYEYSVVLLYLLNKAGEFGAVDPDKKAALFETALYSAKNLDQLEDLASYGISPGKVYLKCAETVVKNCFGNIFTYDTEAEQFLCKTYGQYSKYDADKRILEQEKALSELEACPGKMRSFSEKYLQKSLACSGEPDSIKAQYESFLREAVSNCEKKQADVARRLEAIKARVAAHDTQAAEDERKASKKGVASGIVSMIVSLILTFAAAYAAFYAWQTMRSPESILPYPVLWYTVIDAAICLVGGAILTFIQLMFFGGTYKYFKPAKAVTGIGLILTPLSAVAAAVMIIIAGVNCGSMQNQAKLDEKYDLIVSYIEKGDNKAAADLLLDFDYRDSRVLLEGLVANDPSLFLYTADAGSTFTLGTFEQDGSKKNGEEPILWTVLDRRDNMILLQSEYVIAYREYDEDSKTGVWDNCSLKAWLIGDFYENAFSDSEKEIIVQGEFGNVFILSKSECRSYIGSDIGLPTESVSKSKPVTDNDGNTGIWMRTAEGEYPNPRNVSCSYYISENTWKYSHLSCGDIYGVRPAVWIGIAPLNQEQEADENE